jgi:hypothetical protein
MSRLPPDWSLIKEIVRMVNADPCGGLHPRMRGRQPPVWHRTVSADPGWDELAAGLPVHEDEVMAAHTGLPSIAEQDRTHGAGIPAEDRGEDDRAKLA